MVRVLAWNLEDFGNRYHHVELPGAMRPSDCEDIRCSFVADIIIRLEADVVVIQELRKEGVRLLELLRKVLSERSKKEWHFDWVKGAAVECEGGDYSTDFVMHAHYEGYAVLFIKDSLFPFGDSRSVSSGIDNIDINNANKDGHYISLIYSGNKIITNEGSPEITFATGERVALDFPLPNRQAMNIEVAPKATRAVAKGKLPFTPYNTNSKLFSRSGSRRPCSVILNNNGEKINFVVYHTPVDFPTYYYASLVGFASDDLQVDKCVYCGDFNIKSKMHQLIVGERATTLRYVESTKIGSDFSKSSVKPAKNGAWRNGNDVLTTARDYGFSKIEGSKISVFNVLEKVSYSSAALGKIKKQLKMANGPFINAGIKNPKNIPKRWQDVIEEISKDNPKDFPDGADIHSGRALLYNFIISDHLPVLFSI